MKKGQNYTNTEMAPTFELAPRVGIYQGGVSLLQEAWSGAEIVFEVDTNIKSLSARFPHRPRATEFSCTPAKAPTTLFDRHQVEVFAADHSGDKTSQYNAPQWHAWLESCDKSHLPRIIVQLWQAQAAAEDLGPVSKLHRKPLERLGYTTRFQFLDGSRCGGAVSQTRLAAISFLTPGYSEDEFASLANPLDLDPRPMANCLRPFGGGPLATINPSATELKVAYSVTDPMPSKAGSLIRTPGGYRPLFADELAKGLGIPSNWMTMSPRAIKSREVDHLPGVHLWEAIGRSLGPFLSVPNLSERPCSNTSPEPSVVSSPLTFTSKDTTTQWSWEAPDLGRNRAWYRRRIQGLKRAVRTYPPDRHAAMLAEGREHLDVHRRNYGPDGPQYLQLLWWEFPREHWNEVREGNSMNFLTEPEHLIRPNSKMTTEQCALSGDFVDELIDLGVLEKSDPVSKPVVTNCPLFVLPKPGQKDQWRVLADMKKGGQNSHIGRDPVYLPRVGTILPHLYNGGWSAVIDASKFFYQFQTVVIERKYLGLIHPTTGAIYRYRGLPMGSANSPSIAGKLGASFLRKLCERYPEFQGTPVSNTWESQFTYGAHDPRLGHGRVLIGDDGLPQVLAFAHVDDFFLHAPTREKLVTGLNHFMDLAVEIGMLCNPIKVVPPAQVVKYCGFLYDTTTIPTLRIPESKRTRAIALLEYMGSRRDQPVNRLSLSIVGGVLQSLVDATPSNIGQTFLRRLNDTLHGEVRAKDSRSKYYEKIVLDDRCYADFQWWKAVLTNRICRPVRPHRTGTLIATFGDGSGTGTGGTDEMFVQGHDHDAPLEMWMDTWSPVVHHFSSNWKELKTLVLTLRREVNRATPRCSNATMFYFTDNEVTYHVVTSGSSTSPGLHSLIHEIKMLELQLNCQLVCIHVPGTTIILQGADGLSRGVWISPLHARDSSRTILASLFAPVHAAQDAALWMSKRYGTPLPSKCFTAHSHWSALDVFDTLTLWLPAPEIASQMISFVLNAWVERPHTSQAYFVVPRIFTRSWRYLSRQLVEIEVLPPDSSPFSHPLPLVVLFLPCYTRALTPVSSPPQRFDAVAISNYEAFQAEATMLRGL